MDRAYGVKQYVGLIHSHVTGATFAVFTTGDERFYLFDCMNEQGLSWSYQFPIRKRDLKREVRSMLAHGCGNTLESRSGCANRRECQPPAPHVDYAWLAEAPY